VSASIKHTSTCRGFAYLADMITVTIGERSIKSGVARVCR